MDEAVEAGERLPGANRQRILAPGEADLVWFMDLDFRLGGISASARSVLGCGREDPGPAGWTGRGLTPDSLERCREVFPRMLEHGRAHPGDGSRSWTLELELVRPDGSLVPVATSVSLMYGHDGDPGGMVCIALRKWRPAGEEEPCLEKQRSGEELAQSEARLRLLTQRMLEIQETERARFARDLHDELGQDLVFLKMQARSLAKKLDDLPRLQATAMEIADMADRLKTTSSRIAASIGPGILDGLGLVRAVEWCAEDFERRTGISCPVDTPIGDISVPKATASAAYRILQEALTNVWRHAGASQVEVKLEREGEWVVLTVGDNGVGISTGLLSGKSTLGFLGMQERARLAGGVLNVASGSGRGTQIVARLPSADSPAGPAERGPGIWP